MNIFVSHVNPHQRASTVEKILDGLDDSYYQCKSPFTKACSMNLGTSGHGSRDGGYAWAQQYGPPFIKADMFKHTTTKVNTELLL